MNTKMNMAVGIVGVAFLLTGAAACVYQLYRMTVLDAAARGMKHPKLLGFLVMGGNNSSGLLMYLICRRKYPILDMPEASRSEIERRKKIAGVGLAFLAAGTIVLVVAGMLLI